MKSAFKQAVRWGIVERNPFEDTTLPKVKKVPRAIWDVKTISDIEFVSAFFDRRHDYTPLLSNLAI